jgi:hypothetical protein
MNRPIVLIHGYSDRGQSFKVWRDKLTSGNPAWEVDTISIGNYTSLTDEVTIKDLADGLDHALRAKFGDDTQEFDAIVHSTGMLVIREWFERDRRRLGRLNTSWRLPRRRSGHRSRARAAAGSAPPSKENATSDRTFSPPAT